MSGEAVQDSYPEEFAHCCGCGRLNEHGLKIKSYWEGGRASAGTNRSLITPAVSPVLSMAVL